MIINIDDRDSAPPPPSDPPGGGKVAKVYGLARIKREAALQADQRAHALHAVLDARLLVDALHAAVRECPGLALRLGPDVERALRHLVPNLVREQEAAAALHAFRVECSGVEAVGPFLRAPLVRRRGAS